MDRFDEMAQQRKFERCDHSAYLMEVCEECVADLLRAVDALARTEAAKQEIERWTQAYVVAFGREPQPALSPQENMLEAIRRTRREAMCSVLKS